MPYFQYGSQRLFYRERGEGPPLLILPGNTASSANHEKDLAWFSRRHRTVAVDHLGTGRSDRLRTWPADWWEGNALAAAALIDHLGIGPAVVLGTSGGGVAALLTAIRAPERVAAVVADSCVERWSAQRLRSELVRRRQPTPEMAAFWRVAHGDDWPQVIAADAAFTERLLAAGGDPLQGRLDRIDCPVLLTASLADPVLEAPGAQLPAMAARLARGEVHLSAGGIHPLMWSRPALFRGVCSEFLARCGPG